ncbi:LuxR family transcriptional regulator [Pseudorhodoferax sp.]|uniref:LuxR family transcriptional regulator n=1 Tax=Pseudorhodoferax sp. TaxID=1993553 RepID=UPI0039E588DB
MDPAPEQAVPPGPPNRAPGRATATLGAEVAALGFEGFAMVVWLPWPAHHPAVHVVSNFPEAWLRRYRVRGYAAIDPVLRWCRTSTAPRPWTEEWLTQQAPPALLQAAAAHGLRHGWSQAVHDGLGVRGMFSVARAAGPLDPPELVRKQPTLQLLAHRAHRLVLADLREHWARTATERLTPREVEVLRWAADGKTAQDTAEILGLKLTTVRFHIDNAVRKLQAGNVTAAVFRALVLGVLHGLPEREK